MVVGQASVVRAALLVAVGALMEAALTPLLEFGWVSPKFVILAIVVAAAGQRDLQALLLGFFGGVLTDALGGGIFGVGALAGLTAATISMRAGAMRRKGGVAPVLTVAAALGVAVYDVLGLLAPALAGDAVPPLGAYLVAGVLPDVLLNAALAYLFCAWVLGAIVKKGEEEV
jgi:rod shape-determining protein MreD